MEPLTLIVIAAGVVVASLASLEAVGRSREKRGREREFYRLRRLYITRREAAEYELITGVPLDRVYPRAPKTKALILERAKMARNCGRAEE